MSYSRIIVYAILLILLPICLAFGQETGTKGIAQKQKLEILNAELLTIGTVGGEMMRKLSGDVRLKQDDVILECDSAYFYVNVNAVDAFGNVHISQGDSLHGYSDSLKYDGDRRQAVMYGRVRLNDRQVSVTTDRLIYMTEQQLAYYYSGGRVVGQDVNLYSKKGYFYANHDDAYFKDSVVLIGTNYRVVSDTLSYNVNSHITHFHGPTEIFQDNSHILCETGWYNTKTDKASFGENTVMTSQAQRLYTDSLYFDGARNFGQTYKYFKWTDTTMSVLLVGDRADFYQGSEYLIAMDDPMLIYLIDGDSLFLVADTLKSSFDTTQKVRTFTAFNDVRFYKSNLQGVCDSLFFSYKDSIIRMYRDPILWSDENQLTGDTINLSISNNQLDHLILFNNGFIINEESTSMYNQIKGKQIYGYFEKNSLDRLLAEGNGESVYYAKDDSNAYLGLNEAKCSNMWIYLKNEAVDRIHFLTNPDATFHPIQQVDPESFKLKGFVWKYDLKPQSKSDLFKRRED